MQDQYGIQMAMKEEILFLAWGSPWPALGGGSLRALGLLRELSRRYAVHLYVLSATPLTNEQNIYLRNGRASLQVIPMAGAKMRDKATILWTMLARRLPYHAAWTWVSMRRSPAMAEQIQNYPGVVFASFGHWGAMAVDHCRSNWILDQQNADVDFWRVYASQTARLWAKVAALVNWRLAAHAFPCIYRNVGCIISVCEADRDLTLRLDPTAAVAVIENGVDCDYYRPHRTSDRDFPRILFTGTSAPRNVTALRHFCSVIWPAILARHPNAELLVAGNFHDKAQREYASIPRMRFTGKVDDIRPYFNGSDVFVSPFEETHGSKLKVAEAMAMGVAVVSTPAGVRGFALVDGKSVSIAKSDGEFAEKVVELLGDAEQRSRMGHAARETALATIDWPILGRRLERIVKSIANL